MCNTHARTHTHRYRRANCVRNAAACDNADTLTEAQQTHEDQRNEPVQRAARIAAGRPAAAAAGRRRLVQLVVVLVVQDGPRHLVVAAVRHVAGGGDGQRVVTLWATRDN